MTVQNLVDLKKQCGIYPIAVALKKNNVPFFMAYQLLIKGA